MAQRSETPAEDEFGCEQCFQASAAAFWAVWTRFSEIARLVDESHFILRVVACPECRQRYVAVTTETIDWGKLGRTPFLALFSSGHRKRNVELKGGDSITIINKTNTYSISRMGAALATSDLILGALFAAEQPQP